MKHLAALFMLITAAFAADRPPNIIFIMADDLGRDWLSCYGSAHATPHVDRLAGQGIRFENVWCAPICTPTRIMLLSGLYPFRTGWTEHHDVPRWGGKGFDWERYTCWARVLRDAGYATAIGGKWQVNDLRHRPEPLKQHGFEEHCVWPGGESGNKQSDQRYWNPYLVTNGKRQIHESRYGPDVIAEFLVDFIRCHRQRPFMVYYPKGKGKVTNAGANVPFIVRAPFLIGSRAGQTSQDLIDFTDLYPTFLALVGAEVPAGLSLDGQSFLGLLNASAQVPQQRSWIFSQLRERMVRDCRFLLDSRGHFYDLNTDPTQQNNLAQDTDSEIAAARRRLGDILKSLPPDAGPPFEGYRAGRGR